MIDSFTTALGTALTGFVADVSDGIGSAVTATLPITLGVLGIGIVWAVVRKFAKAK